MGRDCRDMPPRSEARRARWTLSRCLTDSSGGCPESLKLSSHGCLLHFAARSQRAEQSRVVWGGLRAFKQEPLSYLEYALLWSELVSLSPPPPRRHCPCTVCSSFRRAQVLAGCCWLDSTRHGWARSTSTSHLSLTLEQHALGAHIGRGTLNNEHIQTRAKLTLALYSGMARRERTRWGELTCAPFRMIWG